MKRLLAIILVVVVVLSLAACGGNESPDVEIPDTTITTPNDENDNTQDPILDETDDSDEAEPDVVVPEEKTLNYKMAKIGSDVQVSTSKYGIGKTRLNVEDAEGKTFYALSWVFEEGEYTTENVNYYTFFLKDAKTGAVIDEGDREHINIVQYDSSIYDTDSFGGNGIPFWGEPEKFMATIVLYSDYEIKFEDFEVWAKSWDVEYKLDFNAELDEITSAPKRGTGYVFMKFKDSYYVADGASSGGGRGGNANYDIYDYISVQNPLTNIELEEDILDPSKITFYDTETGEHLPCVPGTEVHYAQNGEFDSYDVEIGVITEDEELRNDWEDRYKVFYNQTTWLY